MGSSAFSIASLSRPTPIGSSSRGALLLAAWLSDSVRPTRDADFLGLGDLSDEALVGLFQEICDQPVDSDGMTYSPDSVAVRQIREDDAYGGKRVTLWGTLGAGRIRLRMDIGIGDVVEPPPEMLEYPVILDFPGPRLRTYRPETVVAEKLHAMVRLGAVTGSPTDPLGQQEVLFSMADYISSNGHPQYDVSPDAQRFVMLQVEDEGVGPELIRVENWAEELSDQVGN